MKEDGIRHLAVTKHETVVGIISISDILRYYSGVAQTDNRSPTGSRSANPAGRSGTLFMSAELLN